MKTLFVSALMALVPGLVMAQATPAAAKTSTKKTAKNAVKAPVAKAKAPHKVLVAKAQPTSRRARISSAAPVVAVGAMASGAAGAAGQGGLSPAEMAIAERVHVGRIACELGAHVTVAADASAPGHFHVEGKGFKYYMTPVATSTGVVRLEDAKAGAVWLQIANKSMLMNQKMGQRLADDCMSSEQVVVAESIKHNPPASVFEPLPAAK
ncbi:hypothetical protein [Simplicispira psychrophila]|uniref:hypothetical protein n=1 Tax=Simplicispira psychrophila TaxID=80882 RepID=UPI000488D433|nr:hypothetical protein [Simplicispira psychrophila]